MRDNSDTCAEIELFHLVLVFLHTPCAIAPIRAMLNKIAAGFTGTTVLLYTGTPCAMTLIRAILNKTTAALLVLRMVLLWFYKFHSEVCEVCAHTRTHTHTVCDTSGLCHVRWRRRAGYRLTGRWWWWWWCSFVLCGPGSYPCGPVGSRRGHRRAAGGKPPPPNTTKGASTQILALPSNGPEN